jgi:hypothetical protein
MTVNGPLFVPLNLVISEYSGVLCKGKSGIAFSDYAGYNGNFDSIKIHVLSQPVGQPLIPDFYMDHGRPRELYNLVPGYYEFLLTDQCGSTQQRSITITPMTEQFSIEPVYTCGSNLIGLRLRQTTNRPGGFWGWEIKNSSGTIVHSDVMYVTNADYNPDFERIVGGLASDIYTVRLWNETNYDYYAAYSTDSVCPITLTANALLPGALSLDKSLFAKCTNSTNSGMVVAMAKGGLPPYEYSLYSGTVAANNLVLVRAGKSSNTFAGLDVNSDYTVYVTGNCDGGSSLTDALGNIQPVMNVSSPVMPCPGAPFSMWVNKVPGLAYQWTKNGADILGALDTLYRINSVTLGDSGMYKVTISASSCLLYSKAFELNPKMCGQPLVLPINLVSFTGSINSKGNALLNWSIAQVEPGGKFELLYSTNGKTYQRAGMVQAGNATDFTFTHSGYSIQGKVYYKLLQTDADGTEKHSNTLVLSNGSAFTAPSEMSAAPVPFNNNLTVQYSAIATGSVQISLIDVRGRIVKLMQQDVKAGQNAFTISGLEDLVAGMYMLQVTDAHGDKQTIKVRK